MLFSDPSESDVLVCFLLGVLFVVVEAKVTFSSECGSRRKWV